MKNLKDIHEKGWFQVVMYFKSIDNLYIKFILTIIAIALIIIAIKLPNHISVSGSVGTYEEFGFHW